MFGIVLHGGAGHKKTRRSLAVLERAKKRAFKLLASGRTSLDAVEVAVNILENSGQFNAGIGSITQFDGVQRMDAAIMNGPTLECGAVACIENIKNPISVARRVMEKTNHVLLIGKFATKFAVIQGLDRISSKSVLSDGDDTVGVVALDKRGNLTAGCSTGGWSSEMMPGRVGDSAIIGAGIYATKLAAATTTGMGEAIIRTTLSRKACDFVESGMDPQDAAERCVGIIEKVTGKICGIIIIDHKSRVGVHSNSPQLPWVSELSHE